LSVICRRYRPGSGSRVGELVLRHAQHADAAARACEEQVEVFVGTGAPVPRPEEFDEFEQRLVAAKRAIIASRGHRHSRFGMASLKPRAVADGVAQLQM
jgi:hypothetical protein